MAIVTLAIYLGLSDHLSISEISLLRQAERKPDKPYNTSMICLELLIFKTDSQLADYQRA